MGSTASKPSSEINNQPLVRLEGIGKSFPGVRALDRVSLSIYPGRVLALVGENGAGKSTLMKVLSGVYPHGSYDGKLWIQNRECRFSSPLDAEHAGIAIIHQELASFSHLSIGENLFVGHWPKTKGKLVSWSELMLEACHWLSKVGLDLDPARPMKGLSVGTQQMIEIAKALSRDCKVLILDEPTSALTPKEVKTLFALIRELKARGHALVYISHKMDELFEISDDVDVLRDGKTVFHSSIQGLTEARLISEMVGRKIEQLYPQRKLNPHKEVVLSARALSGRDRATQRELFRDVSFELRKGEILGFAGLLGAGRSELMRAFYGDPSIETTGEWTLNGASRVHKHPKDGLKSKIGFVLEDRKQQSLLPQRPILENGSVSRLSLKGLLHFLKLTNESASAQTMIQKLRVKCTSGAQHIQNLSGGNQQKVLIGRVLETAPGILILDEPTRGVDVGAKREIYDIIFELAGQGLSLLVVSSELPELMGICDRIGVLSQGKWMGVLEKSEFSQEALMKRAVGRA